MGSQIIRWQVQKQHLGAMAALVLIAMLCPRLLSTVLVSVSNIQLAKYLSNDKRCYQPECLVETLQNFDSEMVSVFQLLDIAQLVFPTNQHINGTRGIAALSVGRYAQALHELNIASDMEPTNEVLIGFALDAAQHAHAEEEFLNLYFKGLTLLPRQFMHRFRAAAATAAVNLAQREMRISNNKVWIDTSLTIWPDNLCALAASVVLSEDITHLHAVKIHNRTFDGRYDADPAYQNCVLKWLPQAVRINPDLLPAAIDIFEKWIWWEHASGLVTAFAEFTNINPNSLNTYVALGNTALAEKDWALAQDAYISAAKLVSDAQVSAAYRDLAASISKLGQTPSSHSPFPVAGDTSSLELTWFRIEMLDATPNADDALARKDALVQELQNRFDSTHQIHLTPEWVLQDVYFSDKQLSLSQNMRMWALIEPTKGEWIAGAGRSEDWIQLEGRQWAVQFNVYNLIPDGGFEIHAGLGPYLPDGYQMATEDGQVRIVNEHRRGHDTQVLELTRQSSDENVAVMVDIPVQEGHHYLFSVQTKARQVSKPGFGGIATCDWQDSTGRHLNYHAFYSWYSPEHWWTTVNLVKVPKQATKCSLILASNDMGNSVLFDNLVLVDLSEFLSYLEDGFNPTNSSS